MKSDQYNAVRDAVLEYEERILDGQIAGEIRTRLVENDGWRFLSNDSREYLTVLIANGAEAGRAFWAAVAAATDPEAPSGRPS